MFMCYSYVVLYLIQRNPLLKVMPKLCWNQGSSADIDGIETSMTHRCSVLQASIQIKLSHLGCRVLMILMLSFHIFT